MVNERYVTADGEYRLIGDGMAAAPRNTGQYAGWMDFSGDRVPVPVPEAPWAPVESMASPRHIHDGGCLVEATGGPKATRGTVVEIPEAGWYTCTQVHPVTHVPFTTHLHDHGTSFVSHMSGDHLACPNGV